MKKVNIHIKFIEVPNCFVGGRYMTLEIITRIYKKKFLWWTTYSIDQSIPYIDDPFFDGEYNTNKRLAIVAKIEYEWAKTKIIEAKYANTKNKN